MKSNRLLAFGLVALLSLGAFVGSLANAKAADSYRYYKAQPNTVFSWTGFYVKGDVGYAIGDIDVSAAGGALTIEPRGLTAGLGVGFDYQLANGFVIGGVLDASWLGAKQTANVGAIGISGDVDYMGSVRANLGYAFGSWMPYATVGYSWGHLRSEIPVANLSADDFVGGIAYGAGVKLAITKQTAVSFEWVRHDLGNGTLNFGPGAARADTAIDTLKVGLQYRFGG